MAVRVITGDCRTIMPDLGPFDMVLADPPYGDTSLAWDKHVDGWEVVARACLKPTGSMWVFGSMRFFMATAPRFEEAGLQMAQDVVWEKHNGSGFHADRFKRVHEHAVQFYRADAPWADIFNQVQMTMDADKKRAMRRGMTPHLGASRPEVYETETGGPRIMRSVIPMHSCHGHAIHPTEKPVGLLELLIRTSCPPGGTVADFFAGSGAGGEAAAHAGRSYIGTEVDAAMAGKAQSRLAGNMFASVA